MHNANFGTAEEIRRAPKTVEDIRSHHTCWFGVGTSVTSRSKISVIVVIMFPENAVTYTSIGVSLPIRP